eukprot:CAMPEP_0113303092 /NCGR_PEP_ID=MMETSP0010_2-20120614/3650_1 /TAXON_ID=216773 ORGANISM="Corethron hystrix, Strain 308" /NCGR_SAMPLE_ID=MMETSP0010_2 /ASSEMBLY_ACC=CAM_ASM_000155 /LENGTH=193 /DNA_ID=CAMNT_0000157027 /DNA_START=790 /DNA_END=1371 /DNA_ORIENTATION=+ /assembly_acc=CAM_ASM_000155
MLALPFVDSTHLTQSPRHVHGLLQEHLPSLRVLAGRSAPLYSIHFLVRPQRPAVLFGLLQNPRDASYGRQQPIGIGPEKNLLNEQGVLEQIEGLEEIPPLFENEGDGKEILGHFHALIAQDVAVDVEGAHVYRDGFLESIVLPVAQANVGEGAGDVDVKFSQTRFLDVQYVFVDFQGLLIIFLVFYYGDSDAA